MADINSDEVTISSIKRLHVALNALANQALPSTYGELASKLRMVSRDVDSLATVCQEMQEEEDKQATSVDAGPRGRR